MLEDDSYPSRQAGGYGAWKGHKQAQEQHCMNAMGRKSSNTVKKNEGITNLEYFKQDRLLVFYTIQMLAPLGYDQIFKKVSWNFWNQA